MIAVCSCVGVVVVCHLIAWRLGRVDHWSRWIALAALVWLPVREVVTMRQSPQVVVSEDIRADVMRLIEQSRKELHGIEESD